MDKVLVLDFGSQYTQLIARKVRELGVYSEIQSFSTPLARIRKGAFDAIILSGGPQSVYEKGAPTVNGGTVRPLSEIASSLVFLSQIENYIFLFLTEYYQVCRLQSNKFNFKMFMQD